MSLRVDLQRTRELFSLRYGALFSLTCYLTLTLQSAWAWVGVGSRWPDNSLNYVVYGESATELGALGAETLIAASYHSWSAPECSAFSPRSLGQTDQPYAIGDGLITHQWFYDPNARPEGLEGRATIGVTVLVYRDQEILDGDILYNGIDHRWVEGETAAQEVDAQSIITHEVGHQLGLDHSASEQATMFPSYRGGIGPRSLELDDLNGVCALYPSRRDGDAIGCGPRPPCDADERCIDERCEPIPLPATGGPCPCDGESFCVQVEAEEAFCTFRCDSGRCPEDWRCERFEIEADGGAIPICVPTPTHPESAPRAFGADCVNSGDCDSALCLMQEDEGLCSQHCESYEDCPNQERCVSLVQGGSACLPRSRSPEAPGPELVPPPPENPPGEGENGSPCTEKEECEGGLCLFEGDRGFCSFLCEADEDCPDPHYCIPFSSTESGCWFPEYMPEPLREEGVRCSDSEQCESQLCSQDGRCRIPCSPERACPEGFDCIDEGAAPACLPRVVERDQGRPALPPAVDQGAPDPQQLTQGGRGGCSQEKSQPLSMLSLFALLALFGGRDRRKMSSPAEGR